ncbi:FAD-dependent oxidoreductase [Paraburkholderia phymatum]|uniref:NAD(P)/FAD-dependent oxidoreductase n=1 Tax=Paraburkholderia phymatum TaxID=148447 RepID=UPI00317F9AB1
MTAQTWRRIVIVGAGHAGGRAAINLRQMGYAGELIIVGDETHPPYERPPLSKAVLVGKAHADTTHLQHFDAWATSGIALRLGCRVTGIERETKRVLLADGDMLPYDALILATGARARSFPGACDTDANPHLLRSLSDVARLRPALISGARIGVLGAGFIGLEVASSALELGAQPVVIEAASRPLARLLPAAFAGWLTQRARESGVVFRFDTRVQQIVRDALVLADGERLTVDATVVGIGALPNDELARDADLATDDGVLVDVQCRTSDPAVFAIGDVARRAATTTRAASRIESWRNAEDDARRVAAALLGAPLPADGVPWFWTDVFGHNIQLTGDLREDLEQVTHGDPQGGPFIVFYLAGDRLRGAIGVDCGRDLRAAQKLIARGERVDRVSLPRPKAARCPADASV